MLYVFFASTVGEGVILLKVVNDGGELPVEDAVLDAKVGDDPQSFTWHNCMDLTHALIVRSSQNFAEDAAPTTEGTLCAIIMVPRQI